MLFLLAPTLCLHLFPRLVSFFSGLNSINTPSRMCSWPLPFSWFNCCYGLNHVPFKIVCWSPDPEYFRYLHPYLGDRFYRGRKLTWGHGGVALIQYDWCVLIERGNLNTETCTEESDTKHREKTTIYKSRWEAWNRIFPSWPSEWVNPAVPDFRPRVSWTARQQISVT